jgi:hypothetical protein
MGCRCWHSMVVSNLDMERETCFLTKFSSSSLPFFEPIFFWSLVFGSYWLIVTWRLSFFCILCLVSFWVFSSISHFLFPLHGYAMNRGGGLVYSRRYPKYSRLTLPWIPLKSECLAFNLRLETSQARRNRIFWRIRESMTRHLANRESRLP